MPDRSKILTLAKENINSDEVYEAQSSFFRFLRSKGVWESYSPENSYIVSADVARGDGKDYSVFHVINVNNMEQVAEYQGKPDIDLFASILNDVGRQYGNCLVIVENNNIGYSVLTKLREMNYPNLLIL